MVVVEDMTLADLTLDARVPPPLAAFTRDVPVLTVGSLSKLFWGGLRVGWIRGPEPLIARLVASQGGVRPEQLAGVARRWRSTCWNAPRGSPPSAAAR